MDDLIHIFQNNRQEGPYTPGQVKAMMESGALASITLAWRTGMPEWAPLESFFGSPPPPPSTALAPPPPRETPQPPPVRVSAASNTPPIPSRSVAAPPPVPAYIKRRVKSATPDQAEPEASVWVKALIPAQFGLYIGLVAPFSSGGDSRHPTPFVEKVWLALLGGVGLFAIVYLISVIWFAIAGRNKASVVPNAVPTSKDDSEKMDGTGPTTAIQESEAEEKTPIGPVGISGWLLLPAIGILGKPLTVISAIWNEYLLSKILQPAHLISASFFVSCAMGGIVIAYAMIVAWYFFRRNTVAPKIFIQFLVFGMVAGIASRLIAANYKGSDFDWAGSVGSVIGSGVWILYFLKSKRVKATFTSAPFNDVDGDSRASKVHTPPIVPVSVWFWLANGAVLALMFLPMEDQLSQSVASQTEPAKGAQPSADTPGAPKIETPPETLPASAASKAAPFINGLGMKFVPADTPGILFSVWETRVQDFAAFVSDSGYDAISDSSFGAPACSTEKTADGKSSEWAAKGATWQDPRFPTTDTGDHPVVCVSYHDAGNFCVWLTKKDLAAGIIPESANYRLPSDAEWSRACGIGTYPWGESFPPMSRDGNYLGEEAMVGVFEGIRSGLMPFRDIAARTAPVAMFSENRFGLYDMGGNAAEWCSTWYKASLNDADALQEFPSLKDDGGQQSLRVLRGASWGADRKPILRSSARMNGDPRVRTTISGFRCVLVLAGG